MSTPYPKTAGPLRIQDNTLRDGHQSLFATRMRTSDMIPAAEQLDGVGFWALEIWGGATFDAMHRFLGEDPWERPRILKRYLKKTPCAMLLRGQNLVGYRHYADDVVNAFVDKACEAGIDVFRVFDALNDFRNLETALARIRANGKHCQGTICYSLTGRRLGGDVFTLDYYLARARELEAMGVDSLCIKDMAGIMSPYDARDLIILLKRHLRLPLHLHTHETSGMGTMTYLKAVEAGLDGLDTCLGPFAGRTSMPAAEPLVAALQGTPRDTGLDLARLIRVSLELEKLFPRYQSYLVPRRLSLIDSGVLAHQIPGGMISNLVDQLKDMRALDRLNEVCEEIPVTRRELGNPPLVTPISQIVAVQAVMNVLFGKYKMVSNQLKDLVYGLYGRTPTPVDPELRKKILKRYKRGAIPMTGRPADDLEPELAAAAERIGNLARSEEDVLTYTLYPVTGERFLREKYKAG
ncbi:MAG: pyruvate carboxylase subunit B [Syntrophales bacterium]|nr:pyruvate carboxylase subunit B [Syntrophales bacterium]HOS76801.1 pyruvate carboxylase subunit B [Syntrophales bacterium]